MLYKIFLNLFLLGTNFQIIFAFSSSVSSSKIHAFYYLWYGEPTTDGDYKHWNHEVLPHWEPRINERFPTVGQHFQPPEQLHSKYYPYLTPYSSKNPSIFTQHFQYMEDNHIDVAVMSWWGQASKSYATDTQGINTDIILQQLFQELHSSNSTTNIKIAFHLEPYPNRSIESIRQDIEYLTRTYGDSSYLYKINNKIVFYIYDSYHITSSQWKRLLRPEGDLSLRNQFSSFDGIFFGLWLDAHHGSELDQSGFDGIYTYFATDGFSYGSTTANWKYMTKYCQKHQLYCSLSVGPGYDDSLIRPWNAHNTRDRENGKYYQRMFTEAIKVNPDFISITSFNEWGEGTQIEPAIMKSYPTRNYDSYPQNNPYFYLNMTQTMSKEWLKKQTKLKPNKEL